MERPMLKGFSLLGKVIVLTGAAGFFGRYFAQALLEAEAKQVYLLDRDGAGLDELAQTLAQTGLHNWTACIVDQNNEDQVAGVFDRIQVHDPVDVLVNNAFRFGPLTGFTAPDPLGRVETATKTQVMTALESGTWWSLRATQLVAPGMKARGSGAIINIASMYGIVAPNPALYDGRDYFNPPGYGMAKAAVIAQTQYVAAWLGPEIRCNARKSENSEQNKDEEFVRRLTDRTLLNRLGHPHDLVGPLVFLASDASGYMTGHVLVVDGGWTVT